MNLTSLQIALFISQGVALVIASIIMLSSPKRGFGPMNIRIFLAVFLCPILLIFGMEDNVTGKAAWALLGMVITFAVNGKEKNE